MEWSKNTQDKETARGRTREGFLENSLPAHLQRGLSAMNGEGHLPG